MTNNGYFPKTKFFSDFELNRLYIEEDGCYYKKKPFEVFMIIGSVVVVRILLLKIIFRIQHHKNRELSPIVKRQNKKKFEDPGFLHILHL